MGGDRPNIVWLVTEDNSVHYLRLYSEGGAPMPNVERLAEHGFVFNHAFSNAPVCSTARSTIISGCYGPRVFSQFHRRSVKVPMPGDLKMFPVYLRDAGYYTSNNNKEDYNFIKSEGVWDDSSRHATYRNRDPGQPFFHVQNFGMTHEGQLHFKSDEMASVELNTSVNDVSVFPIHPDSDTFRYTNAWFRDRHRLADEQLGLFLNQLEADGLMEDTIIFYYGDHGGVLPGSKGYAYERGLHVPMVVYLPEKWQHLAPLDWRTGENLSVGQRLNGFVQFVDLGPTVLNLAGLPVPDSMDGSPFLGVGVDSQALEARNTAFGYADRFDEKIDFVRTLRRGSFKYIRSFFPFKVDALQNNYRYRMLAFQEWRSMYRAGELDSVQRKFFEPRPAEALYDLKKDPFETHNLADDPAYRQVLEELRSSLRHRLESMPDLSFFPEPVLVESAAENPVRFGWQQQARIRELYRIADLSLVSWEVARGPILTALESEDPLERYWAIVSCSSHGEASIEFAGRIEKMATEDLDILVRMRASEYLGLLKIADPRAPLIAALYAAESEVEAFWILNTIVLLHDLNPEFPFTVDRKQLPPSWMESRGDYVNRRLDYLEGL